MKIFKITLDEFKKHKEEEEIFEHKLKALCLEYDAEIEEEYE